MKTLFIILALLAFAAAPPLTIAQEKSKPAKVEKVYCCHEKAHDKGGKCDKLHTKAECEKEGGKVVSNCKDCK